MMFYSLFRGNNIARVMAWIITIISCIGNSYILYLAFINRFRRYRFGKRKFVIRRYIHANRPLKIINILICHLALADLLGGLYLLIITSADIYYGSVYPQLYQKPLVVNATNLWAINPLCFLARFCHFLSSQISILITLFIAIDRFTIVIRPANRFKLTRLKSNILALACWIIYSSLGLYFVLQSWLMLPRYRSRFSYGTNLCLYQKIQKGNLAALTVMQLRESLFYVCCSLTILLYMIIIAHICCHKDHLRSQINKIESRLFPLIAIISISNFASLIPETVIVLLRKAYPPIMSNAAYQAAIPCSLVFTFSNTAINPVAYLFFSKCYGNINFGCCRNLMCFKSKTTVSTIGPSDR